MPTAQPPAVDLAFLLNQTSYALGAQMAETLSGLGISVREYCVLMKADGHEHTQNALAELAALDKTTMVVTLDRLEAAGLAERRVSSTDRRARVIAVTPRGRKILLQAYTRVAKLYDGLFGALSKTQREALVSALDRLATGPLAEPSHLLPPVGRRGSRSATG